MLLLELLSFVFVFVFGQKYVAVFVFVSVSVRKWNVIFGLFSFSAENVKSVFGRSLSDIMYAERSLTRLSSTAEHATVLYTCPGDRYGWLTGHLSLQTINILRWRLWHTHDWSRRYCLPVQTSTCWHDGWDDNKDKNRNTWHIGPPKY